MSEPQQVVAGPSTDSAPEFKVYKPSDVVAAAPPAVLPDEYFTPTAADLRAAQSQLAARTQALTNAPLRLKTTREAEEKAKRDRWPNTTIRIRFTDRTQLEKVFPSTDKIRSVYAFVRELLREDVKPIKFILYQAPNRDLKVSDLKVRDLTLAQLQLAPSSVLLIRFEDDSLNGSHVPAPLITNVLSQAVDLPRPPEVPDMVPSKGPTSKIPASSSSSSGEKKVPKWLKLGKK
ncbi:hypothetical protein EV421DRAFT_1732212 [Armillaria borealis]|uniref:UBX domain-containing protein n=1 Tax=Armillaria borealis TaxID=47425 RepID=A0AA39MXM4_9AGAR|nr:hypothetical protein EV421DRAFT_1732212 [Armillaria borealis]